MQPTKVSGDFVSQTFLHCDLTAHISSSREEVYIMAIGFRVLGHHVRKTWWMNYEADKEEGTRDQVKSSNACPPVTNFFQLGPTS
jgi:hypothetical protein